MSRVGKRPIDIPEQVEVSLEGSLVKVKGPKGELAREISPSIKVRVEDGKVWVERQSDEREERSLHGLVRVLLANMIEGVSNGFEVKLLINGVGYRAFKKGNSLELQVGLSHPVIVNKIEGVDFEVPDATTIVVKGIDKERVGQAAAEIRAIRPPEPYKGKGIRYVDEYVKRKAGKAGRVQ